MDKILVRYLAGDTIKEETSKAEQEEYLPRDRAALLIADRKVEPVVTVQSYDPACPPKGLSLGRAFDLHVAGHPDVENGGKWKRTGRIPVKRFSGAPTWSNLAPIAQMRWSAGLDLRGRTRLRPPPKPEALLESCIAIYFEHRAIHAFLERLRLGELASLGVYVDNLMMLDKNEIPAAWWERDILVHLERNEIFELTATDQKTGEQRWTDVVVRPGTSSYVDNLPGVVTGTGAPGRRTSMHLVKLEYEERKQKGAVLATLREESEELAELVNQKHPHAPHVTPKTIQNNIRRDFRIYKEEQETQTEKP